MRVPFGEWRPDSPDLANPGMTKATGVVPVALGYGQVKAWVDGGHTALTARARGAISVVDAAGNPYHFAGDTSKLYKLDGTGFNDVSKSAGYNCTDEEFWSFAYFDNTVYAVNMNDDMQYFDLQSSTLFDDVATGTLGAPRARHIGVVRNQIVVGNIYTVNDGLLTDAVAWSPNGNPRSWPTPGGDAAISALSGQQQLHGGGGWVMAITNDGAEVGGIFQEHAIWRMDFEGGQTQYRFTRVEPRKGCMIPGLAISRGREVLYCDEDGWYIWNYTTSRPVGEERVNRTFLADLDTSYLDRVSWAQDPDSPNVYILYAGSGNSSGTPNKCLVYNWILDRFSEIEFSDGLELLTRYLAPGTHIDSTPDDDIDGAGLASLDQRQSNFGAPVLGAYDTNHSLGSFSGDGLAATLETGDVEFSQDRRSFVTAVRPLVKGATATVQVAKLDKSTSTVSFGSISTQDNDGKCPVRSDGRYHRFRANIPAGGFTDAIGLDVDVRPSGRR